MGIKTVQDTSLTSVANAIRVKAEISGTLEFPDEFVSSIQNISTGITPSGTKTITENGTYDVTNFASADVNVSGGGGSVSVPPKEVNFYDYDGTVVDAYTASEFASLSAMPQNPKHTGLTAQGWNWSLADAKTYVAKYGRLNIGQMYVTKSGDTEIDIELHDDRLEPVLGICPNGTVEIDWGDGSAVDVVTGSSTETNIDTPHVYASGGHYTITLHGIDSYFAIYGGYNGCRLLYKGLNSSEDNVYCNSIQAVRLGEKVYISGGAFQNCTSLRSVTIPHSVRSMGQLTFKGCSSLVSVTIPDSLTSINNDVFTNCHSLASVTIPHSVTLINVGLFTSCSSLASVTIPDSVTSIKTYAFQNCYGIGKIIFNRITPPTAGSNAFGTLPSDLVVYVPAGTLETYKAASNYSSISSKMVEMAA